MWLTGGGFYSLDSFFCSLGLPDHVTAGRRVAENRGDPAKDALVSSRPLPSSRSLRHAPGRLLYLRRLVPAGTYPSLRGDALSSLFYFANWHFILSSSNYFDQTDLTSPLIHMWSLSVEEQFYLRWPLIVVAVFAIWRSLRVLLMVCVVGALASAAEMALLFKPGNTTRIYFGTDTHAQSLLVGAALAVLGLALWSERRWQRESRARTDSVVARRRGGIRLGGAHVPGGRRWLTVVGLGGIVGSAVLYMTVNAGDAFAYRGGFLLASLATGAVLLSISCAQRSPVARILSFGPCLRLSAGSPMGHTCDISPSSPMWTTPERV